MEGTKKNAKYNYLKQFRGMWAKRVDKETYDQLVLDEYFADSRTNDKGEVTYFAMCKWTTSGLIDKCRINTDKYGQTLEIGVDTGDHISLSIDGFNLAALQDTLQKLGTFDLSRPVVFNSKHRNENVGGSWVAVLDKDGNKRNGKIFVNYGDEPKEEIENDFEWDDVPKWVVEEVAGKKTWNRNAAIDFLYKKAVELVARFDELKGNEPDAPAELESDPLPAATKGKKTEEPTVEEPMDDLPF